MSPHACAIPWRVFLVDFRTSQKLKFRFLRPGSTSKKRQLGSEMIAVTKYLKDGQTEEGVDVFPIILEERMVTNGWHLPSGRGSRWTSEGTPWPYELSGQWNRLEADLLNSPSLGDFNLLNRLTILKIILLTPTDVLETRMTVTKFLTHFSSLM